MASRTARAVRTLGSNFVSCTRDYALVTVNRRFAEEWMEDSPAVIRKVDKGHLLVAEQNWHHCILRRKLFVRARKRNLHRIGIVINDRLESSEKQI